MLRAILVAAPRVVATLLVLCPLLVSPTLLGFPGAVARAQDEDILTGTLKTIHERGTILIGYREAAPPFSFRNKGGQPIGFSLDLCHGIAEQAAARLGVDLLEPEAPAWQKGLRIVYVPVATDARLPKVMSGAVDLECGSTTANAERAKSVAFSPVFFLAGTKLMAPLAPAAGTKAIASYRDLAGRRVAVGTGTTNAPVIQRLAKSVSPPITVVETPGLDESYAMLASGAVDAFASDDILLQGFIATRPDGKRFAVVGDYLSYEPYAIMLRKDDPDFAALVETSFERMAADGTLFTRYRRWFLDPWPSGETLNLPISAQLSEMYRALGQPD
jgi:glutamate/aspartate transport system substrate-binding protein